MNGNSQCAGTFVNLPAMYSSNTIDFYIDAPNSQTTYYNVWDTTNGNFWSQSATNIGSWSSNRDFQSMSESSSALTSVGEITYSSSEVEVGSTWYNVGGSSTTTPSSYGGVCSASSFTQGSWYGSPSWGYTQPSFTIEGFCVTSVPPNDYGQGGNSGSISNPSGIVGAPDGSLTMLAAPNLNDYAWVVGDLGAGWSISPGSFNIALDAYSYNNGQGAYYSDVQIQTSSDNVNWNTVYSGTISPSSTNLPTWMNLG